jgi:hypothetical protein
MSLWHADDPDGGTNPRGSIAENSHAPVPPPRPRRALLLRSLTGLVLVAPFLDIPAASAGATWTRPAATAGAVAGASEWRGSTAAQTTELDDSAARRRRANERSGSRGRRAIREDAQEVEEPWARAWKKKLVAGSRVMRWRRRGRARFAFGFGLGRCSNLGGTNIHTGIAFECCRPSSSFS